MIVKKTKIEVTQQDIEIDITEITLISNEEHLKARDYIPNYKGGWWWFRSPGAKKSLASFAYSDGVPMWFGQSVDNELAVRPALRIRDLKNLKFGDEIQLAGFTWTIIPGNMALSNEKVSSYVFRKNWFEDDANDYEKSDIKRYLNYWAKKVGINFSEE